jgi:hypothetical protein
MPPVHVKSSERLVPTVKPFNSVNLGQTIYDGMPKAQKPVFYYFHIAIHVFHNAKFMILLDN